MKRVTAVLLVLIIVLSSAACGRKNRTVFLDIEGNEIGELVSNKGDITLAEESSRDFLNVALSEALQIICEKQSVDTETALKYLYKFGYTVSTTMDPSVQKTLVQAMENEKYGDIGETDVTVCTLDGAIAATYSRGSIYGTLEKHIPCSALKPLSVYTPLLEEGIINWSSVQEDSPVKEIEEKGESRSWPSNADGVSTGRDIPLAKAIRRSYNTVAVRWLQVLGTEKSMEFLNILGIKTDYEKLLSEAAGEEEILGALGLGYLSAGVTSADMAENYAMFANGGVRSESHSVISLKMGDKSLYEHRDKSKQIIKSETAYIMNRLLSEVVRRGTGTGAILGEVDAVGKTGTSDDFENNWFCGITPEYSCAIWHGAYYGEDTMENIAPDMFADIFKNIPHEKTDFTPDEKVGSFICCEESGGAFSDNCKEPYVAYYLNSDPPGLCNIH